VENVVTVFPREMMTLHLLQDALLLSHSQTVKKFQIKLRFLVVVTKAARAGLPAAIAWLTGYDPVKEPNRSLSIDQQS
jgi:hypothetical protein